MSREHRTPAELAETIEDLEALANGELDFATEDTERFFANPRVGAKLTTPNGSIIRVTDVKTFQFSECDLDMWLLAAGEVLLAPQCPRYVDSEVTFLVKRDGSICFAD